MNRIEKFVAVLDEMDWYEGLDNEQIADFLWEYWFKPIALKRIQSRVIELAKENRELKRELDVYKNKLKGYEAPYLNYLEYEIDFDYKDNHPRLRSSLINRIWNWITRAKETKDGKS
jgi:hypothetical protein